VKRKQQVWVIFCDYVDQDGDQVRTVLDMQVHPAASSIKELTRIKREIEEEMTRLHHGFFIVMTMANPVVSASVYPRLTSKQGKRQFMDYIQSENVSLQDVDFDTLFAEVEQSLRE
jgi:esterase/lipase